MEGETSVDDVMSEEMLSQLRKWQQEQKNRLIEQQQHQRQLLIEKQKKLLSMINTCETTTASDQPSEMTSAEVYNIPQENSSNYLNTNPTSSPPSIDDVPLKKPRAVRSFQQLLENSISNKDQVSTAQNTSRPKKFPFLKRGQGISRFGVISKPKSDQTNSTIKKSGKENQVPSISTAPKTQKTTPQPKPSPLIQSQFHLSHPVDSNSIPLESKKVEMQVVPFQAPKFDESTGEGNSSRNEEDLEVFELLERFANINASFSSSSSLIGQLIDKGVTHLPSPSKVMNFLSKKRQQTTFSTCTSEDTGVEPERKSGKSNRHVRFAESIEEQPHSKFDYDGEKPWLEDISEEEVNQSHPSPYISNTIRTNQQSNNPSNRDRFDLDETPTSPIGFPDYQKLFGNPVRSLWVNEELPSPTQDDCAPKDGYPMSNLSLSVPEQLKDSGLPSSLPIEDPRLVYQASLVRSRLTSLEREIANYRRETDAIRRARKEHDESKQKLEQEQEKFRRYTENEKRRLQLLYSEEQKRVRSEQLKDLPQLKENEEELKRLREELMQAREEHRQKENKWMASQTKVQERIRSLELRNRELTESLEKVRTEEQNLRRRLNASLRPGALGKNSKSEKGSSLVTDSNPIRPPSPQIALPIPAETSVPNTSPRIAQKDPTKLNDVLSLKKSAEDNCGAISSPGSGTVSHTVLPDGTKLVMYPNGNRKEIWPDGRGTQVIYYNGDIKQKLADGSVIYTYADSGTKHTTKQDGTDILEFSSGQIETTYPDGRSQVQYPGGAMKMKYPDGREDSQLPDGTKLWTDGKGHGVMTFSSGIREIYTPICKRREYPDGTVKTVYEDGRSETRYSNGRIRVKDSTGKIITDTGEVPNPK